MVVVLIFHGECASAANCTEFCVASPIVLALPEFPFAGARGVVVGRAGTVSFLPLMAAREEDLKTGGDEKEDAGGWLARRS